MCGRYTVAKPERLAATFTPDSVKGEARRPRYNIAPMQKAPVVAVSDGKRVLADIQWGFLPAWAKAPSEGQRIINARGETAAAKPAFRESFRKCRCLVPADGFYEWKETDEGRRPFYFRLGDGEMFAFAGLYSRWPGKDSPAGAGAAVLSFAIVTAEANALMRPVHDRMPVILPRERWNAWLDPENGNARELGAMLAPYAGAALNCHPVSRLVNSPARDVPGCIEPETAGNR